MCRAGELGSGFGNTGGGCWLKFFICCRLSNVLAIMLPWGSTRSLLIPPPPVPLPGNEKGYAEVDLGEGEARGCGGGGRGGGGVSRRVGIVLGEPKGKGLEGTWGVDGEDDSKAGAGEEVGN